MSSARLSLHFCPSGATASPGEIVYDIEHGEAYAGEGGSSGPALRWRLGPAAEEGGDDALLSSDVHLDPTTDWIARCDRVWFPPGSVAYRHTHPGPGIRYLLHGALTISTEGHDMTFVPGGSWFESGPEPVLATASSTLETEFVRVLLLPAAWAGKRTIRYVDPADDERPKLQRPTVLLEHSLGVPQP